jgi:hypothetical protein
MSLPLTCGPSTFRRKLLKRFYKNLEESVPVSQISHNRFFVRDKAERNVAYSYTGHSVGNLGASA